MFPLFWQFGADVALCLAVPSIPARPGIAPSGMTQCGALGTMGAPGARTFGSLNARHARSGSADPVDIPDPRPPLPEGVTVPVGCIPGSWLSRPLTRSRSVATFQHMEEGSSMFYTGMHPSHDVVPS
jgi:hypothetical protein